MFNLTCRALAVSALFLSTVCMAEEQQPKPQTIRVQVLGSDEKPLQGARIHSAIWAKDPLKGNRDYVCDGDGKAAISLPQEVQILRLWASMPGHVALFANWGAGEDLPSIPDEFTFKLEKGTVIGGTVKNDDGEPIAGAIVQVMLVQPAGEKKRPMPNTWLATEDAAGKTDAKGRWSINNVPAGDDVKVRVMLSHPKYVSETRWGSLQEEQGVTMKAFRDETAILSMHSGVPLSGILIDQKGKGVPDALVVWGDDPYFTPGSQEVFTDADGRFRFPPLSYGLTNVTAVAPGFSPIQQAVRLGAQASIEFVLEPGKKLRIKFVDRDGEPVPDVAVTITQWRNNKALFNVKHPNVVDSKIPRQSDKKGIYEWDWAPADEVTFAFYKTDYVPDQAKLLPTGNIEYVLRKSK